MNDRLDVALAANAAGVHLGENSLPLEAVAEWRRSSGRTDFLIGVSCHSLDAARAAERGGADYIFFGPVFATPSKAAFGPPQGIERLREVCAAVKIPVLAIGGITSGKCARVPRGRRRGHCGDPIISGCRKSQASLAAQLGSGFELAQPLLAVWFCCQSRMIRSLQTSCSTNPHSLKLAVLLFHPFDA